MGGFASLIGQVQNQIPINAPQNTQSTGAITPLPSAVQTTWGQPSGKGGARSDGLDQNAINANPQGFQQWQAQKEQQPQPLDGIQNGYFPQSPNQPRPMGKGGVQSNSATSGQPRMGAPNQYPNTVGQWDNTQQQTQQPMQGKGKGA